MPTFLESQGILDRLISKIDAAAVDPEPSDNIFIEDVFDPDLYNTLLRHLPPSATYQFIDHPDARLSDGTVTRRLLDLTPQSIAGIAFESQAFWHQLNSILRSDSLRYAVLNKFRATIDERFRGETPETVTVPILYRDYPGYFIGRHPDSPVKVATLQFYLPHDMSQINLGTSFHSRHDERFPVIKTNTFKPNSGYAFVRTDTSWHSVAPLGPAEKERDSLALTIYIKGQEFRSMAGM